MVAVSDKSSSAFAVHVVSQEEEVFSGHAQAVFIRGSEGDLGIYPGHSQLLTRVAPGPMRILTSEQEYLLYISGGVLEVQPDCVSVLADVVARPQDMDEKSALEAKKAAEQLIAKRGDIDYRKTQHDLAEAMAKLQVLEMMRLRKKR